MNRFIFILFATLISTTCYSQTIENVDYNFSDGKILIYYDITNCNPDLKYEVGIKFVSDKGNTIIPRNLIGDAGIINCGRNKKVIWELFNELESLEGNYKVNVFIINIIEDKKINSTRIISNEKRENQIFVDINKGINQGIKLKDKFSVYNNKKNIGIVSIKETSNTSKGVLRLKPSIYYDNIKNTLPSSNLYKFKSYELRLGAGFSIFHDEDFFKILNLGFDKYIISNILYSGVDFKYITSEIGTTSVLSLLCGITPFYKNNKNFHLGIIIPILPRQYSFGYLNYKPKYGFYSGYQYKRVKLTIEYCVENQNDETFVYAEENTVNLNFLLSIAIL